MHPVIEFRNLTHRYGRVEALHGLQLSVEPGRCHGFFGRNGAGKTTAIKCLLNLLRPTAGSVAVFGLDPVRNEAAIKSRLAYVPDFVAFYPWMTVREALDYQAAFRERWNQGLERSLLDRFGLDPLLPVHGLSKGQRTQLALIGAIAAEPELLVLDEPTSGLDPLVRREFIQTVIGAYQEADPGRRTVFVSTHLISEFEGLIDRFTVLEQGRAVLTAEADAARATFRRLRAVFAGEAPPDTEFPEARSVRRTGRELELIVEGNGDRWMEQLRARSPVHLEAESLTLEEIFMATVRTGGVLP
ncbi:MAG: ABC transporter ATP-binding protein [Verrucomicrobiae bacterium]|nr:ABC transporter ATP-binding protein [Verrucomicrobiae bacterium]